MERFILHVDELSKKSIDPTRGVGALLFKNSDETIVSEGYNKFSFWVNKSIIETLSKDEKGVLATHAEIDCLDQLSNYTIDDDYTMVISCSPCLNCAIAIANTNINITRVVYAKSVMSNSFIMRYKIDDAVDYLNKKGIEVILCHIQ